MSNIVILMQYFVNFPLLTKGIFTTHGSFLVKVKKKMKTSKINNKKPTFIRTSYYPCARFLNSNPISDVLKYSIDEGEIRRISNESWSPCARNVES